MSSVNEFEWLWYMRYGHINFRSLVNLAIKNLVYDLPKLNPNTMKCETLFEKKAKLFGF